MKVLKIKIYQPSAHFRVPFTYQRRHTYPIPPYSTVIGFLCNILGIKNERGAGEPCEEKNCSCDYHKLKKIKISICGSFDCKTTEYMWFRNLEKRSHISRFGSIENRYVGGHIEHIGGQQPVLIDILNEVNLSIYLYHEDKKFLEKIKKSIENPQNRIYPLHLGRAEDWIVIKELDDEVELKINDIEGNYNLFFWIPEKFFKTNEIKIDFKRVKGLLHTLPTFYKIIDGTRGFCYTRVKLNDGDLGEIKTFYDEIENLPVFFADFEETGK